MDQDLLREVQLVQLDILNEVDKICKNNNIKYFLIGGTLLGAVRHGGFIPWDDDLDIAMFREDYNKFLNVCKKELDDAYFLQNTSTEKNYWMFITKIRKNNTVFDDNITVNTKVHNGIYIDIFPLDNIPSRNSKTQKFLFIILRGLIAIKLFKNNYRKFNNPGVAVIARFLSFLPHNTINSFANFIVNYYNNKETGYVTSWLSNYGYLKQKMSKSEIYGEGVFVEFEGKKYRAPKDYKVYLINIFGDYMKLPPENERGNRHIRLTVKL